MTARGMLGAFTPSERVESVVYGLDEVEPARIGSLDGLLSLPFQRGNQVSDTKVRLEAQTSR